MNVLRRLLAVASASVLVTVVLVGSSVTTSYGTYTNTKTYSQSEPDHLLGQSGDALLTTVAWPDTDPRGAPQLISLVELDGCAAWYQNDSLALIQDGNWVLETIAVVTDNGCGGDDNWRLTWRAETGG
jgi:hypothetical protein